MRGYVAPALVLVIAAGIGGAIGIGPTVGGGVLHPAYGDVVTGCTVTDGDAMRCNGDRSALGRSCCGQDHTGLTTIL